MVDSLLDLKHNNRTIFRMSVNPEYIIRNVEFGTSNLLGRIDAINKLVESGYKVGVIIAPIIMVENWKQLYYELVEILSQRLSKEAKDKVFFEMIFMTYSFVHNAINTEAFPNAIKIYDKELMRGSGKGKYYYRNKPFDEGKEYVRGIVEKFFPSNTIEYIV
ncbi:Spore photoproduct lyase [compost metagenome]